MEKIQPLDKELQRYYQELKKHMVGSRKEKKRLLSDIKLNINNYMKENSNCVYQEIIEHFGTPLDILDSYVETLDVDDFKSSTSKSRFIKISIAIFVGVFLLLLLILFIDRQINKPTTESIETFQSETIK